MVFCHILSIKKFKESYQLLEEFQDDNLIVSKLDVKKFQLLGIELILDFLELIDVPLSLQSVVNNIHKIPELIHRAFPSYVENDILFKAL